MPSDEDTVLLPPARNLPPTPPTASAPGGGQHCASCGASLAPDQRYCVECGQRRGPTRPPFLDSSTPTASAPPPPPQRKAPRISPNTALIAGIGTLMLAMATGVLIGRTSAPSSKNAPVQYVTAPTTGGTTGTTGTTGSSTPSTEGSASTKSSGKGSTAKTSGAAAASKVLGGKAPEHAVVKTGSPGKGPGYQKGHFTGKFFGGSSSKKKEEEEELGE